MRKSLTERYSAFNKMDYRAKWIHRKNLQMDAYSWQKDQLGSERETASPAQQIDHRFWLNDQRQLLTSTDG